MCLAPSGFDEHRTPDIGQQTTAQQPQDDEIELAGDLVLVPVAVRDAKKGGAILGLRASDFTLAEDGARQEIAFFNQDTVPVDVVLLVDSSRSVESQLEVIQRAAYEFAKQLRPEDRLSIVAFADRPVILLDWANDLKATTAALRTLEAAGNTALYSSIVASLRERYETRPPDRRRAMVVLTDGVDTLSSVTSRTASQEALRRDVTVYSISTGRILDDIIHAAIESGAVPKADREKQRGERNTIRRAEEPLTYLSDSTGGRVLFPHAIQNLSKSYAEIAGELRSRYLLGYYPAGDRATGFHSIAVATVRANARAHARQGYFREST
jgi:Ca-activated chloride channel homolog